MDFRTHRNRLSLFSSAVLLGILITLSGCNTDDDEIDCKNNDECLAGEVCQDNICVDDKTQPSIPDKTGLEFIVHPAQAVVLKSFEKPVQVEVFGDDDSATVELELVGGNKEAIFTKSESRTVSAKAKDGVATFSDLSINETGARFQLSARADGQKGINSDFFDIIADKPDAENSIFEVSPASALANGRNPISVKFTAIDSNDNRAAKLPVTLKTSVSSDVISHTRGKTSSNGVFEANIRARDAGERVITLTADGEVFEATVSFEKGAPMSIEFVDQPQPAMIDESIGEFSVAIRTTSGHLADDETHEVKLQLVDQDGNDKTDDALNGDTTQDTVDGVATFDGLTISEAGEDYYLIASSDSLGSGDISRTESDLFTISEVLPPYLQFETQPAESAEAGEILGTIKLQLYDAETDEPITDDDSTEIALALVDPDGNGATLDAQELEKTLSDGAVEFDDLSVDKVGEGYQIRASSTLTPDVDSDEFEITVGQPDPANSSVSVDTSETYATDGEDEVLVEVTIEDAFANPVPGATVKLVATPAPGLDDIVVEVSPETAETTEDDNTVEFAITADVEPGDVELQAQVEVDGNFENIGGPETVTFVEP